MGKLCKFEGCKKSGKKKGGFCIAHGGTDPRCKIEGCNKKAQTGGNCVAHGGTQPRCKTDGCNKKAKAGGHCIAHGGTDPMCKKEGCTKKAQTRRLCKAHGGGDRCPNCVTWIDARCGSKKYDGYCATCFKQLFPKDPRSTILYLKSHETAVRNFLAQQRIEFIHDTPIYTPGCDCTHRRRVDFRIIVDGTGTVLAIEVDERQHSGYDKIDEEARYNDIFMASGQKWVFIRFNPDSFLEKGKRKNPKLPTRFPRLMQEIDTQIKRIQKGENTEFMEVVKLFYDA